MTTPNTDLRDRIARLAAQSDIRGRAVVMYRERARAAETAALQAEARLEAARHLFDEWGVRPGYGPFTDAIRRALEG